MNKLKKSTFTLSFAFNFCFLIGNAQLTNPSPYCSGNYDNGFMPVTHFISKVSIGTLTNNSGNTQYPGGHYVYYNNLVAPNLAKNSTYTLSVNHDGGGSIHFVAAFIDFNKDNDFNDPGEKIMQKSIKDATPIPNPINVSVTIPSTVTAGSTRMRVMVFEDDLFTWIQGNTNANSCTNLTTGFFDWGETEDYVVNITQASSIYELIEKQDIIYPIPTKEFIYIDSKYFIDELKCRNVLGELCPLKFEVQNDLTIIDLSGFNNGVYFLSYNRNGKSYYKRIIKE